MLRRLIVLGSIGLALVLGTRFALSELTERAWQARKQTLLTLALDQPMERRPWELRFESLQDRLLSSARFQEIARSPYHASHAWESTPPRPLDAFERVWLESLENELVGLNGILAELRKLPEDELVWHGDVRKLSVLRECTNALCARAWRALDDSDAEGSDDDVAPRGDLAVLSALDDALRLARATDDGSTMGTMIAATSEGTVLAALRGALARGLDAREARRALVPRLEPWAFTSEHARRVIRRDLSYVSADPGEITKPREALAYFAPVESALETADTPLERTPWAREAPSSEDLHDGVGQWNGTTRLLHGRHAQRNVALTALAVAAFRAEHGAFPATLAEIPDLPSEHALDPLTGAPLAYACDGEAARVGPAAWGERVDVWRDVEDSPYFWALR